MKLFSITVFIALLFVSLGVFAQKDKSKRPSPPATVTQKIGAATVSINYSQPSVKGRTIGVDLEPLPGKVWRAGANEATILETDKDILLEGKIVPAGKYSLYILQQGGKSWNIIINKSWNQWGTKYDEAEDLFRVPVRGAASPEFAEKLTYTINTDGIVSLLWGEKMINFQIQEKK